MADLRLITRMRGARAVELHLEEMPERLERRLAGAIEDLTQRLAARVRAAAPRRTGRLASEIEAFLDTGPGYVRGRVKVVAEAGRKAEYGKAAALEYGAHNRITVREHKRRGRGIGMETIVDRYQRTVNIVEHRYLRGPLDAMRGQIEQELAAAMAEAAAEG